MSNNRDVDSKSDESVSDETDSVELCLIERAFKIPCLCPQCDGEKWPGINPAFLCLVERGQDQLLETHEAEWEAHAEHLRNTRRPVWTAEDLASVEDRGDRARIAAAEDIDIYCARTRFVVRDLAEEGFWGHAAVDRLTPTPVPEKPQKPRRRRKQPKPAVLFDLFGDFGVIVPVNEHAKPSKAATGSSAAKGDE